MPTLDDEVLPMEALTAQDRCDRCGAQAYMRVVLQSGFLLFCAHHARDHKDAVVAKGGVIAVDDTAKLSATPVRTAEREPED